MKKNILWALIALFAATFEGAAQNNSYNMVITMANGTTISIGPNEVKNISFNDGKVEMTGQTLDQLVERVERVEELSQYNHYMIEDIRSMLDDRLSMLYDRVYNIEIAFKELESISQTIVKVEQDLRDKIRADSTYLKKLINDIPLYDDLWIRERIAALEEALKSREVKSATKKEDE